eukprot:TRINITY_DN4897_c0_g1_i1.p1 TRINITY_DN4897_c0_g1~~TRINITY_DN4897_c0_g1_i1.p1  ORF type:complete len:229 (+),score=30.52 TRINITY_DN4897_c0_g1_i1:1069-1755(+)
MSFTGDIPPAREFFTITKLCKFSLLLFGGYLCIESEMDNYEEKNFNDFYLLSLPFLEWKKLQPQGDLPSGRSSHTSIIYKKKIFIFGGIIRDGSSEKVLDDTYLLDFGTLNEQLSISYLNIKGQPPIPRYGHSAEIIHHHMIIFGGKSQDQEFLNNVVLLDLEKLCWVHPQIEGIAPEPRMFHATVAANDHIIIMGGKKQQLKRRKACLLYTSPSPRDRQKSRMPSSA